MQQNIPFIENYVAFWQILAKKKKRKGKVCFFGEGALFWELPPPWVFTLNIITIYILTLETVQNIVTEHKIEKTNDYQKQIFLPMFP